jgi:hypothetical protein
MGSMHCEQECEQYDTCAGKSTTPEFRSLSHKWQPGSAFQAGLIPVNFSEILTSVAAPILVRGELREGGPANQSVLFYQPGHPNVTDRGWADNGTTLWKVRAMRILA